MSWFAESAVFLVVAYLEIVRHALFCLGQRFLDFIIICRVMQQQIWEKKTRTRCRY